MATELVEQALRLEHVRPTLYRDKLERAARLDPQGEHGRRAQALLKGQAPDS
jgi:hypothetical protein